MAEGERTFLGLTHNPFVEPCRGFFECGGRKKHLEQLRHLSQWSRRVLLVTGPEGVGKTTLYRELAATLEPRIKAARISGTLVNARREVLAAIAQGFGIAVGSRANVQTLHAEILAHVENQSRGERPCLVLVDDVQLLESAAVDALMALAHESALHLVLFGEVSMVPVVERAASSKGIGWQEIRLTGYDAADAREYMEWRFGQAKYRGRIPFTDSQIAELIRFSEGLPGRINQMANVLLVKLESGEAMPARRRFPRQHLALLVFLSTLIGVLYVMYGEEPPPLETASLGLPEAAGGGSGPVEPAGGVVGNDADPLALDADHPGPAGPAPREADTNAAGSAPVASGEAPDPHQAPTTAGTSPVAAGLNREPGEAPAVAAPPPAAEGPPAGQPDAVAPVGGAAGTDAGGVAPDEDGPVPEDPEPRPAEVAAPPVPEAGASPEAGQDTRWLLRQNPDYYTLQLLTLSAPDRARAFVARQREPGEFAIYQLQRDGRVLHVVLYGVFSSREAAQAAADDLPAEVGDVRPWIRRIGQVQSAVRTSTVQ